MFHSYLHLTYLPQQWQIRHCSVLGFRWGFQQAEAEGENPNIELLSSECVIWYTLELAEHMHPRAKCSSELNSWNTRLEVAQSHLREHTVWGLGVEGCLATVAPKTNQREERGHGKKAR